MHLRTVAELWPCWKQEEGRADPRAGGLRSTQQLASSVHSISAKQGEAELESHCRGRVREACSPVGFVFYRMVAVMGPRGAAAVDRCLLPHSHRGRLGIQNHLCSWYPSIQE